MSAVTRNFYRSKSLSSLSIKNYLLKKGLPLKSQTKWIVDCNKNIPVHLSKVYYYETFSMY